MPFRNASVELAGKDLGVFAEKKKTQPVPSLPNDAEKHLITGVGRAEDHVAQYVLRRASSFERAHIAA